MDEKGEKLAREEVAFIHEVIMRRGVQPNTGVPDVLPDGAQIIPYKKLAASVLCLAFRDIHNGRQGLTRDSAVHFVCHNNPMLQFWCRWLNFDPDYVIGKAKELACKTSTSKRSLSYSQELLRSIERRLGSS